MNHYCDTWIHDWCQENGWTDPFKERHQYWAFPPHAVMPLPIPNQALQMIKGDKGLSQDERWWCLIACLIAALGASSSYFLACPMPLVAAFAFCAVTAAQLEVEYSD